MAKSQLGQQKEEIFMQVLPTINLLYGISISEKEISKYNYPISLDFYTRANTESTRSNSSDDPDKMFIGNKDVCICTKIYSDLLINEIV